MNNSEEPSVLLNNESLRGAPEFAKKWNSGNTRYFKPQRL